MPAGGRRTTPWQSDKQKQRCRALRTYDQTLLLGRNEKPIVSSETLLIFGRKPHLGRQIELRPQKAGFSLLGIQQQQSSPFLLEWKLQHFRIFAVDGLWFRKWFVVLPDSFVVLINRTDEYDHENVLTNLVW